MLGPILALRPFMPAWDDDLSTQFYEALGVVATHRDDDVTTLKLGSFGFILQKFFDAEAAENCTVQLLVRDVDAWWAKRDPARLVAPFGGEAAETARDAEPGPEGRLRVQPVGRSLARRRSAVLTLTGPAARRAVATRRRR